MRRAPKRRPGGRAVALGLAALVAATGAACSGSSHGGNESGNGSGGGTGTSPGAPPPPQTQQAHALAQKELGLLSGGGWAQAWALWTTGARRAISQPDFVRLNTECRPDLGVPYVIVTTTVTSPTSVTVDWHHGSTTGSGTMRYQTGSWRFEPDARTLADYRLGVTELVKRRRAAGSCH